MGGQCLILQVGAEILITNRIKTIMQHSPGVVGGVAEAAAGDEVGMGPVNNNRTNKSPWRMSIYPHGRGSPCTHILPAGTCSRTCGGIFTRKLCMDIQ